MNSQIDREKNAERGEKREKPCRVECFKVRNERRKIEKVKNGEKDFNSS